MTGVASSPPQGQQPSVSVIIPAYNAASYIRHAVDSALGQTTGPPREILVVDDGSKDETAAIASGYGPPVRLLQQANSGVAHARNRAASEATGNWLAFLDADDLWMSHKIERQLECVGDDTRFVYTDRRNVGVLEGLPVVQGDIQTLFDGDVFERLIRENFVCTSSVLVERSLFVEVGGFDIRLRCAEDWDLWLKCAERTAFAAVREPLVEYRLHPEGASRDARRMNRSRAVVVERALRRPRAAAFSSSTVRHIRAEMWRTNGWDAARAGQSAYAMRAYLTSLRLRPFQRHPYLELVKLAIGR